MLTGAFEYHRKDFKLNAEFQLEQGIMGIIGDSGVGKSTLLKNIVGLLKPSTGIIQLKQNVLFNNDPRSKICVPMHQRKIALVFQNASLFPHMRVLHNLKYAEKFVPKQQQKFHLDQVIDLLQLNALISRHAHELSGGEAQRVSIGRALLSSPELLLLDEPLSGLDSALKNQILTFLRQIDDQYQLPMIYVTHHLSELQTINAMVYTMLKNEHQQSVLSLV